MVRLRVPILAFALLACFGSAGHADAAKVYRWTDRNGVSHYGDHVPDSPGARPADVRVIPVEAEPGAMARLRLINAGDRYQAWVDNSLSGPIEVEVAFNNSRNVTSRPSLPARATIAARGTALVAELMGAGGGQSPDFELAVRAVPGDPRSPGRVADFVLPLQQAQFRIEQGFGGGFSHATTENHYALDFAAPIGTPVLAARGGVVMQVESDFSKAGLDSEEYYGRANFIRIVHDDGSMALYAHLKEDGVLVRAGQRVQTGQQIGLSGNTGFTSAPHLHFVVQINRGMRLESIPFRMSGPSGPLRISGGRGG